MTEVEKTRLVSRAADWILDGGKLPWAAVQAAANNLGLKTASVEEHNELAKLAQSEAKMQRTEMYATLLWVNTPR